MPNRWILVALAIAVAALSACSRTTSSASVVRVPAWSVHRTQGAALAVLRTSERVTCVVLVKLPPGRGSAASSTGGTTRSAARGVLASQDCIATLHRGDLEPIKLHSRFEQIEGSEAFTDLQIGADNLRFEGGRVILLDARQAELQVTQLDGSPDLTKLLKLPAGVNMASPDVAELRQWIEDHPRATDWRK